SSAPVNQLVGYGAGTTGGGSGSGTTVTSCSAFRSAAGSGGVIRVSGTLSGCGIVDVTGGTTVIGVGASSGFVGGGIRIRRVSNVIIRNLRFKNPPQGGDLLALDRATQVWIDHNEFSNDGLVGDKDFYDGLLDITHASDFVTVSWNTFADHWKGSLVGHSASNAAEDQGKLRVTYHHNWWNQVNSRTPSLRFGTGHIYSSCYENIPGSGLNIREGARALVEQNYFRNVKDAIHTNLDANNQGFVTQRNNVFSNSNIQITQTGHTNPPYSYTVDEASCICDRVKSQAGTGII
ncbi:pectin lyase fold/virulence factor, partial [Stachybotrys elegans]